jgi:hypothetical protein
VRFAYLIILGAYVHHVCTLRGVVLWDHIHRVCSVTTTMYWRERGLRSLARSSIVKSVGSNPKDAILEIHLCVERSRRYWRCYSSGSLLALVRTSNKYWRKFVRLSIPHKNTKIIEHEFTSLFLRSFCIYIMYLNYVLYFFRLVDMLVDRLKLYFTVETTR